MCKKAGLLQFPCKDMVRWHGSGGHGRDPCILHSDRTSHVTKLMYGAAKLQISHTHLLLGNVRAGIPCVNPRNLRLTQEIPTPCNAMHVADASIHVNNRHMLPYQQQALRQDNEWPFGLVISWMSLNWHNSTDTIVPLANSLSVWYPIYHIYCLYLLMFS